MRDKIKPSFFFLSGNRGWSKYCRLRVFFFYSLVFVFQRLPCPPVHPAWNVAQKVDVVWSYQRAPEWSCPRKELETLPTSSKALGSKPSIVLSRLIHLGALWVKTSGMLHNYQIHLLFNCSTVIDPFRECVSLRPDESGNALSSVRSMCKANFFLNLKLNCLHTCLLDINLFLPFLPCLCWHIAALTCRSVWRHWQVCVSTISLHVHCCTHVQNMDCLINPHR